ncbi:RNA polymerase sigma factor [Caenispirillum salinarum]|uniref:RNA polymerase sigma factor n=1 Tax=Caenispirillum salinarum TaxID=859058 RepID=UPI00384E46FC
MSIAFDTLLALFAAERRSIVRRLVRMVGCRATAEDLAQEAYTRLIEASGARRIDRPQPFLYRTAENLALDHLRRERGRRAVTTEEHGPAVAQVACPLPTPDKSLQTRDTIKRLTTIVSRLPERRRQVFLLRRLHGWRYAEIAAHLGISVSATEKHMRLAMEACVLALADEMEDDL